MADEIITPLGLGHTGFYRADALPANTALGYTGDAASGRLRANLFSLPVLGGSDGGLYTCARDLDALWRGLFGGRLLSEAALRDFCAPQIERGRGKSYGLGVYRHSRGTDTAFYAVGGDFGIDFFTVYFPRQGVVASALGNTEVDTAPLLNALIEAVPE